MRRPKCRGLVCLSPESLLKLTWMILVEHVFWIRLSNEADLIGRFLIHKDFKDLPANDLESSGVHRPCFVEYVVVVVLDCR
jgi:hypothetical protein